MKQTKSQKTVLHLVLKHKWFDMIEAGIKIEEYRDIEKWCPRICSLSNTLGCDKKCIGCKRIDWKDKKRLVYYPIPSFIEKIVFHRGYTSQTITKEVIAFNIGYGLEEWGAPKDDLVLIIRFFSD